MLICKLPSFVRISYEVQRIDHSADMVLYRITAGGFIRVYRLGFLGGFVKFLPSFGHVKVEFSARRDCG